MPLSCGNILIFALLAILGTVSAGGLFLLSASLWAMVGRRTRGLRRRIPFAHKAFLPLCVLLTFCVLEVSAMPISYASQSRSQSHAAPAAALSPDPFGAQLLTLLEDAQDVASERVWQDIPKLIARSWQAFSQYQSPLSTMGMISRAAETVLKIRLASRRGGGEEEARRLEDFQALMAEIWGTGTEEQAEEGTEGGP